MNKETADLITIALGILGVILLGVFMLWAVRWSRKKSAEFKSSETAQFYQNDELKNKPVIEQLRSKETWLKVLDGMRYHDPKSIEAKAIRNDLIGYLGWVPFTIGMLFVGAIIIASLYFGLS